MQTFRNFFPPQILAQTTPRWQDFTLPKERDTLSSSQKDYLKNESNIASDRIFYGRQVHGNGIVVVTEKDVPLQSPLHRADGFVTNCSGLALGVRTADCLPIFMFDSKKKAVALVHAGWQGSEKKVALAALTAMNKQYGTRAADVLVAFGPCIRSCCYEVGKDFQTLFPKETSEKDGKFFLDVVLANKNQLLSAGVTVPHICDEGLCTCCSKEFYSFRREGTKAGRHLSLMMLCV